MQCVKKIKDNLFMIGANSLRATPFEGTYPIPRGISYNAYLLKGQGVNILFDTVDVSVQGVFLENLKYALCGEKLNYVVVHHMEPDHSATLETVLSKHPEAQVICSGKTEAMLSQFATVTNPIKVVTEGETISLGRHELTFVMAPMVHWPEVMLTFDKTDGVLYSADAFGHFASPGGATFADEVDFDRDYLDEARRYYANIVGKYGAQVQTLLKKAAGLDIKYICPLHGFVWRKNFQYIIKKYLLWSSYTPEEKGVMIAYGSVYGNTALCGEILAAKFAENGIKTEVFDVSVTHPSEIVSSCFKYSHLIFLSSTYNNGIFVNMETLLHDLAAHNLSNRTVALVENGSWAPNSKKLMVEILSGLKNIKFVANSITIKSKLTSQQKGDIENMVNEIAGDFPKTKGGNVDKTAMFKLSYGLYLLSTRENEQDNGCIINTAVQLTDTPCRVSVAVNKQNFTCQLIEKSGKFNVTTLSTSVPFKVFEKFGFKSGKDAQKFDGEFKAGRSENGIYYLEEYANAFISCDVESVTDYDTHILFVGKVTEAKILSSEESVTYAYYHSNIKPKPAQSTGGKWVCKICGYVYDEEKEGVPFEKLPEDWVCPLCKHPKSDFEKA